MIHEIILQLPDEVYAPLLQQAKTTGRSVEAVAGAFLAESVASPPPENLRDWVGCWASNVPDAGVRHDDYLADALYDELRQDRHD